MPGAVKRKQNVLHSTLCDSGSIVSAAWMVLVSCDDNELSPGWAGFFMGNAVIYSGWGMWHTSSHQFEIDIIIGVMPQGDHGACACKFTHSALA